VAELLKTRGYATACFGKWHLGRPAPYLPTHQGFDEYFGLPYSNDMWPDNPAAPAGRYPPLPLIEGDQIVETQPDQSQLTRRYTEHAVGFIEKNRQNPFFLYLAHSMPHVPLFAGARFRGRSRSGLYGDVIEEIDESVGQVLAALRRLGLDRKTLVIFTSDNGPWQLYGDHAGAAGPFSGAKASALEGGVRVPFLIRWPGHVPPGRTSAEPLMTIDLLPTLARLAGASLPVRPIDGRDVWPILSGAPGATNPHTAYGFWYNQNELQAVRSGPWKLILPHRAILFPEARRGNGGKRGTSEQRQLDLALYHVASDPGETRNLAATHPEELGRLLSYAEEFRQELGDSLTRREGRANREPARWP
jgi:arylsulfatase A-like enzyme